MKKSILLSSFMVLLFISPTQSMYTSSPTPQKSISIVDLAERVNERLSYMKAVAAYKWQHQLAIEDLEREAIVIQSSMDQAASYGLDSVSTRMFFEEQIGAAKRIQHYWFKQWEADGLDLEENFGDLNNEIRPALLELGKQILVTINMLKPWEASASARQQDRIAFIGSVDMEGLGTKEELLLFKALTQIRGQEEEEIFQVSRLDSLLVGQYDGKTTYGALKHYGDFGVGTFDALDGEMVALDGNFYQVRADGVAYPVKNRLKTPFAVVTQFQADLAFEIDQRMSLAALLDTISTKLDGEGYYAIRVDGDFQYAKTRSVHAQSVPYPPLTAVVADQEVFEFENIQGTMVGYFLPEEVAGENAVGYHFHFLTADRQAGGHLLDGIIQRGTVSIDISSGLSGIKEKKRHHFSVEQ